MLNGVPGDIRQGLKGAKRFCGKGPLSIPSVGGIAGPGDRDPRPPVWNTPIWGGKMKILFIARGSSGPGEPQRSFFKVSADLYNHCDATEVGNDMRVLITEMAGRASIELKGRELGFDLTGDAALLGRVVDRVKDLEAERKSRLTNAV